MNKSISNTGRIEVTYRLVCDPHEAEILARKIAYEQTVELPEHMVTDPEVLELVVGRIESVIVSDDNALARISFNPELCNSQLPQLLNLIFGNVSIFPGVRIVDLRLPPGLLSCFAGPGFGIDGLRHLLGVYDRPLLASAIKPRGAPLDAMAEMAGAFALGGGDIIKDDQNLVDDLTDFKKRTGACYDAVRKANEESGRNCLYFPHVSAPVQELEGYFEYIKRVGIKGVLLCPMILGLDTVRSLASQYALIMMAHPALTGSYTNSPEQGITHEVLLGTLFRMAGADISIFPNYGGRFSFSRTECHAICERLLEPLAGLNTSFPAPAGGMQYDDLPELCSVYGKDAVFLIGGSLQGHDPDLAAATRAFQDRIREYFTERLETPAQEFLPACEIPGNVRANAKHYLTFCQDYNWEDRESIAYKPDDELPFAGVRRIELMGQHGEKTAFDLRYFEIEPDGYTSLEKHRHAHVVIVVRGMGVIIACDRCDIIRPMDIAYIAPMEIHQIRNNGSEQFGFFCIVDHDRDRPIAP